MNDILTESLAGIGPHFTYFLLATMILAIFVVIFIAITPYREFSLIKQGNSAAAISLGGSLIGFSLPLAKAVAQSTSLPDMLIWSGVALLAQLIAYGIVRLALKDLAKDIREQKSAPAIFLAAVSIAIGLLNAAAMTL